MWQNKGVSPEFWIKLLSYNKNNIFVKQISLLGWIFFISAILFRISMWATGEKDTVFLMAYEKKN